MFWKQEASEVYRGKKKKLTNFPRANMFLITFKYFINIYSCEIATRFLFPLYSPYSPSLLFWHIRVDCMSLYCMFNCVTVVVQLFKAYFYKHLKSSQQQPGAKVFVHAR